jgi:hypothetical protein
MAGEMGTEGRRTCHCCIDRKNPRLAKWSFSQVR